MPQYAKALDDASRPESGRSAWARPYALAVLGLATFLACLTLDTMLAAPTSMNSGTETHEVVVRSWSHESDERLRAAESNAASRPRLFRAFLLASLVSTSGWWWQALSERLFRNRVEAFSLTAAEVHKATGLPVLGNLFPLNDTPATTLAPRASNRFALLAAELVIAAAWAIPVATIMAQPHMLAKYRENPLSAYCESIQQIAERLGVR